MICNRRGLFFNISCSNSPTLLACSSCDLALQFSRYIALHLNHVAEPASKIVELQVTDNTNTIQIQQMLKAWEHVDILFYIMEKVKLNNTNY